jgi:hypothetical protein
MARGRGSPLRRHHWVVRDEALDAPQPARCLARKSGNQRLELLRIGQRRSGALRLGRCTFAHRLSRVIGLTLVGSPGHWNAPFGSRATDAWQGASQTKDRAIPEVRSVD